MQKFDYDIIVLGGGAAGLTASKLAQGMGQRVLLVERDKLGGECTWTGCVPSKTIIKTASVARLIQHADRFGLHVADKHIDTANVFNHIKKTIERVYKTHTPEKIEQLGIDVMKGDPVFIDDHHISLNDKTIATKSFILATGSAPAIPPIEGIEQVPYLTNQNVFNLKALPKSMIILGGGAIGTEMAGAFNKLGVAITIIEMQERLLMHDDAELVALIMQQLRSAGVTIKTNMRAIKITQEQEMVTVTCMQENGQEVRLSAEKLLVATGRKPNVEGLYADRAGITFDKKRVIVDEYLRTTARNIYACGDVTGPYLFSHMAFHQATVAVRNAIIPFFKKKMDYRNVCWVIFTQPEFGVAGMTEEEARAQYGDAINIYRIRMDTLDRAITEGMTEGLAKFICNKHGKLIGAHIFGAHAGDLLGEIQLGKTYGIEFADWFHVIHPYPTFSEVIWHAAKKCYIDRIKKNVFLRFVKALYAWWKKITR